MASPGLPGVQAAARGVSRYPGAGDVHEVVPVGEVEVVHAERSAQGFQGLGAAVQLLQGQLVIGSLGEGL